MSRRREELRLAINRGNKYWLLLVGAGDGCDYSIDCNLAFEPLNANDMDSATTEAKERLDEINLDKIEEAIIIDAVMIKVIGVNKLQEEKEKKLNAEKQSKQDEIERKMYEHLKKKFGD